MGTEPERHSDNVELPRVAMEADIGVIDLAFGYVPKGDPTYSDVPTDLAPCSTESAAEVAGAVMVGIGNWRSFTVEKRYYEVRP